MKSLPLLSVIFLVWSVGCNALSSNPTPVQSDSIVSIVNVTDFDVTATVSGILEGSVDTETFTVEPSSFRDVAFVCLDELVLGDPLVESTPAASTTIDGEVFELEPFSLLRGPDFECGEIIEVIISESATGIDLDVFVITPPSRSMKVLVETPIPILQ